MLAKGECAAYAYAQRGNAAEVRLLVRPLTEKAALTVRAGESAQTMELQDGPEYAWTQAFRLAPRQRRMDVVVEAAEGEVALQSVHFEVI